MKRYTVAVTAMLLCISGARVGAESPNILLITSEDHSPDIGCYGDKTVPTPHLDALAEQGVLFERAYVPLSVCSPSRAKITPCLARASRCSVGTVLSP